MYEDRRHRERFDDVAFQVFGEVVPAPHGPGARDEDVHADETPGAGASRAQGVELHAGLPVAGDHALHDVQVLGGERSVQQPVGSLVQDAKADPHYVRGDDERDQGVQDGPARRTYKEDAGHHPGGRPHVREEVPAVGAQRGRAEPTAGAQQHEPDHAVQDGGRDRDDEAQPDVLQRLGVEQPPDRRRHDKPGGGKDQSTFEGARKELGLGVAVGVLLVGGTRGGRERPERPDGRDEVRRRFGCVREQAQGARE